MGNQRLHVALRLGHFVEDGEDEPEIWGIVLADVARHIASGLASRYDLNESSVLSAIQAKMMHELEKPSSVLREDES